ncbi:MAG: hypothetical protein RIB45_11650 [Marivibrio sp.]|uniref:hypothetical protein n=1 Tax=Marivibrio sp. TaxID=2039719 RepID=UPI0032ED49FC
MFLKQIGLPSHDYTRAQFIEVGFVYTILVGYIISMLILALEIKNGPLDFVQSNFWKFIYRIIVFFNIAIYIGITLFCVIFFSYHEWRLIKDPVFDWELRDSFYVFFTLGLALVSASPLISYRNLFKERGRHALLKVLHCLAATFFIFSAYVLFGSVSWIGEVGFRFGNLVLSVALFVAAFLSTIILTPRGRQSHMLVSLAISAPFFIAVYYLSLSAYASSLYRYIPMNRGGFYPVSQSVLTLGPSCTAPFGERRDAGGAKDGGGEITVYVLARREASLYVIPPTIAWERPLDEIFSMPISCIRNEKITRPVGVDPRSRRPT